MRARMDMVEVGAFRLPKAATRIGDPKGIGWPVHKFHAEFERLAPKSSTRSTTSSGTTSSPKPRSDAPYLGKDMGTGYPPWVVGMGTYGYG